jgi:hypothetical protein
LTKNEFLFKKKKKKQALLYDKIAAEEGTSSLVAIFQTILNTIFSQNLNLWFVLSRGSRKSPVSSALTCPILLGMKNRIALDCGLYKWLINKPLFSKTEITKLKQKKNSEENKND